MYIPNGFHRDLQAINPKYSVKYNEYFKKWQIYKNRKLFCTIPYPELDSRILNDLRRGLYYARHVKELVREVDDYNENVTRRAEVEDEYISRYMAKCIWRYYKEPMVC